MGELQANRSHLQRFHLACFIIGLVLSLSSFWLAPFSSFSLVANTLTTMKVLSVVVAIMNGVGFFVLAYSKADKHKIFSPLTLPLAIVVSVLATYIVLVLFGAPLLTKVSDTFHLACLLAACSVLPFVTGAQRDWDVWIKIVFLLKTRINMFEWNLFFCAVFPIAGCLVGSAFIPLDWDRPWQRWPITCAAGCMLGFTFAHLFCLLRMLPTFTSKVAKWKFI